MEKHLKFIQGEVLETYRGSLPASPALGYPCGSVAIMCGNHTPMLLGVVVDDDDTNVSFKINCCKRGDIVWIIYKKDDKGRRIIRDIRIIR